MKTFLAIVIVLVLLFVWYEVGPNVDRLTSVYLADSIRWVAKSHDQAVDQRADSLTVMSLSLRQGGKSELAQMALRLADSLRPNHSLTKGLLGLYALEQNAGAEAVAYWQAGSMLESTNANLSYLAGLDTAELEYVDTHMLEKMFVDTVINSRLKVGLYHSIDTALVGTTERKVRIDSSLNYTFYVLGLLSLIFILLTFIKKSGNVQIVGALNAGPVQISIVRATWISAAIKLIQILAALYGSVRLGKDVIGFVSGYILSPANLIDLFTSNIWFTSLTSILGIFKLLAMRKIRSSGDN